MKHYAFHTSSNTSNISLTLTTVSGFPHFAVSMNGYPTWDVQRQTYANAQWTSQFGSAIAFDYSDPAFNAAASMPTMFFVTVFSFAPLPAQYTLTLNVVDQYNVMTNASATVLVDGQAQARGRCVPDEQSSVLAIPLRCADAREPHNAATTALAAPTDCDDLTVPLVTWMHTLAITAQSRHRPIASSDRSAPVTMSSMCRQTERATTLSPSAHT